jgi:hypothetical protein
MVLQSIIDNNPPGIAHDAGLQGTFKQWLNRIRSDEELRTLCERAAACDGTPESQKFGAELLKLGDDAEADTGRRLEQTCRALAVQYKSLSPVAQQRFSSKMAEVSIQLISHNPKSAGNELALVAGEFAKQHGMVIPKLMDVEGALIKAQRLNDALQILKLYDDVLSSKPAGLVKVDAQRAKDELTKLQKLMGH